MRNRIDLSQMPRFWPPKPSRRWQRLLAPMHRYLLHRHHQIADVRFDGLERVAALGERDGVLICPNHSYTGDGSVMLELIRRAPREIAIMAAWHVFRGHWGLDGFLLQRMGGFSVDREGCDRRAIRTAIELLSTGRGLIIFPEGEIYHLNERLTALREGVAFIAVSAQRELEKSKIDARVWLMPAAIRYEFVDDVLPELDRRLRAMEKRMLLKPPPKLPLHERIVRFGEMLLTIKEKEKLGRSNESVGDLPARIRLLTEKLLERLETQHLSKTSPDETVPVRVKSLRRQLIETLCEESADPARLAAAREALDDVHMVLQLFSYPGDYVASAPTPLRMAETIEKFEEDLTSGRYAAPVGRRRAQVTLGTPIDVRAQLGQTKARQAAGDLTTSLERHLQHLMGAPV